MRVGGAGEEPKTDKPRLLIPLSALNSPVMAHVLGRSEWEPGVCLERSPKTPPPCRALLLLSSSLVQGLQHPGEGLGLKGGEAFSVCTSVCDRARKGEIAVKCVL